MSNTGDHNTGENNIGHCNTGFCNTGSSNTGHRNTGESNTGNYNTGSGNSFHYNTGHCNTGLNNTGHYNTGSGNSFHYNTGHCNTGLNNTGHYNTGNWNAANSHAGCFNTVNPQKAYYFNTLIDKAVWDAAGKPDWLYEPSPTTWVNAENMTDEEKAANPTHEKAGGYLRVNDMKDEWLKAYAGASPEDIQAVRDLPAFDYDVFEEITGLDLRGEPMSATCEGREIEIDGVTYVLKVKGER